MSPVDDFRFMDFVPCGNRGFETGCLSDPAVDVDHAAAGSADEMMMVVSGSGLEASRRTGRLDPAQQPMFDKRSQSVVDRLSRDRPDPRADVGFDEFSGAVGLFGH